MRRAGLIGLSRLAPIILVLTMVAPVSRAFARAFLAR